jgi:hypothetical protein
MNPEKIARDHRHSDTWLREQLEDLAFHVENAERPSKRRTAEALRAISRGAEWRLGRWP